MIRLAHIAVRGQCTEGPFAGTLELSKGLQVISADNAFGKSLAVKSVAWCLGVEPIFGIFSNDATCFPQAVLERLQLQEGLFSDVLSSEREIGIVHERRAANCSSSEPSKVIPAPCLSAKKRKASGCGKASYSRGAKLCRTKREGCSISCSLGSDGRGSEVPTFKGTLSEVYLENLVPSFYIDQTEGWTELQAQQIGRCQQFEIKEIAVEYLLGAVDTIMPASLNARASSSKPRSGKPPGASRNA